MIKGCGGLSEFPCNGPMRLAWGGRSCHGKDADEERQEIRRELLDELLAGYVLDRPRVRTRVLSPIR